MIDYGKDRRIKIANRLKDLREREELTQDQLAEKILISKPTINKWERQDGNNKIPNMDQLTVLSDFYDCSIGYLLCEYDSLDYENGAQEVQLCVSPAAVRMLKPQWYFKPFSEDKEERIPHYDENKALSHLIENSYEITDILNDLKRMQNELDDFKTDPEHQKYETLLTRIDVYFETEVTRHTVEPNTNSRCDWRRDCFIKEMEQVIKEDGNGNAPCSLIRWKDYGRLYDILKEYEYNALMYQLHERVNGIVKEYIERQD